MTRAGPAIGVALTLALASCERRDARERANAPRETAPAQSVIRLLDLPWRLGDRAASSEDVVPLEVCGNLHPGFAVDEGVELRCELTLPSTPSWLDVDVALLEQAGETAPPPPARLTVTRRTAGGSAVSGSRGDATLYDAIPSPGTPPTAFGFGRARIEIVDELGTPCELCFRVTAAQPGSPRKAALGDPRLVPRVTASARSHLHIELFAAAPDVAMLQAVGPDGPQGGLKWSAFRDLVADGATWRAAGDTPRPKLPRDSSTELAWFGPLEELGASQVVARLLDEATRTDPYVFRAEDPFVVAHRGWDEALLRDRFRALGERALFRTLAQPRRADACVFVATSVEGEALDAALARLLAHLRANELWGRTDLTIRVVRTEGVSRREAGAWVRAAPR